MSPLRFRECFNCDSKRGTRFLAPVNGVSEEILSDGRRLIEEPTHNLEPEKGGYFLNWAKAIDRLLSNFQNLRLYTAVT